MAKLEALFATQIYKAPLTSGPAAKRLNRQLRAEAQVMAVDDVAGRNWSKSHGYQGYTSYASLNDLPRRSPAFADLAEALEHHFAAYIRMLNYDGKPSAFALNGLWVNILEPGGVHTGHIHPLSVVSGTYYVDTPKGSSALKFEDPRLGLMMAAPPRKSSALRAQQSFVYIAPAPGLVVLWESWLRHEVPANQSKSPRMSISFNFGWA